MFSRVFPSVTDIEKIADLAIREDIGSGDITTSTLFSRDKKCRASFLVKSEGILAGLNVARTVFEKLGPPVVWEVYRNDGDKIQPGDTVVTIEGYVYQVLSGERVALNLLQRLSGIATYTSKFVERVKGLNVKIVDTRKTTPCLRILEKYAVGVGGGYSHRMGLYDAVMIKDNHLILAGSIKKAVSVFRSKYGSQYIIEVETTTLEQVIEALESGADVIMLDNMSIDQMKEAVDIVKGKAILEASGNVTLETVRGIAETGVDVISVGALTHSVRSLDISLEVL